MPEPDFVKLTLGTTQEELDREAAQRTAEGSSSMRVRMNVPGYMSQQRHRYAHPDFSTPTRKMAERRWIVASVADVFSIRLDFAEYLLTDAQTLRTETDGDALVIYLPREVANRFDPPFVEPAEAHAAYDATLPAFKAAQAVEHNRRYA